jgi:ABC-type branched-subunit amino acid transport system substrate-binding protein
MIAHRIALAPFAVIRFFAALSIAGLVLAGCEGGGAFGDGPKVTAPSQRPVSSAPTQFQPGLAPTEAVSGSEVRIALLLPFTHKDKNIRKAADALLEAAQMAIFDSNSQNLLLMPRDTGSTPEQAAAAAQDVLQKGAELILGPLLAADVRAVAPIAAQRSVPVIAFSNDRDVAGNGVFLLSFPPEEEVRRIVQSAAQEGRGRFAALIPDNAYGARVDAAFQKQVAASGRELTAVERYRPDPQALDGAVKKIAKTGFDTIFLPDGGAMLRSLAPILTVNGVHSGKVRFLGTTKWDDPAVAKEPSLIGGWYVVPPQEQRQSFMTRYSQTYGAKPPPIASLAYDAVALSTILAAGSKGRRYTTASITDPNGFAGIDGIFRFLPDGLTERGLSVMEIQQGGTLRVVDPAPASFQKSGS